MAPDPRAGSPLIARLLFLAIAAIELAHTATAILQHRIPAGHDGFQYFTLQYYFLNNAVQAHEVAQWIPFMTHGTVSTFWYGIQGSFLQNVLLYTGPLVRRVDLLAVFHAGMFVDEMILLTGTWLLARRFFRTPAAFFVAASVLGTCVWLDQPYWNFRLYYAIPLVLELGHRFLDTARWRWLFLAVNLLALQTVGNLPYFIPVVSFVVAAYFGWFAAANPRAVWERVRALRWGMAAGGAIVGGAVSLALVYRYLTIGTDQLVSHNVGRGADGSIDLAGFLTYGGFTDLHKWLEMVLNLSPWLDLTLYAGILTVPLLLCGIVLTDRRRIHLVLLAATLLLFTLGTPVAVALFHAWPGMRYFRHIGLVSPLVKVLFCFVAGIGFEPIFDRPADRRASLVLALAGALMLAVAGGWLARTAASAPAASRLVATLAVSSIDGPLHSYQPDAMRRRIRAAAMVAFGGAAILAVIPFAMGLGPAKDRELVSRVLLFVVLAFVSADVYRFKFQYLFAQSDILYPSTRFVTRPAAMPYPARREGDLQGAPFSNARVAATLRFSPVLRRKLEGRSALGATYWTDHAFWFTDEVGSSLQVDSWLRPLDQLMRLFRRLPIDGAATVPGLGFGRMDFPLTVPALRVAGVTADKIRFFAHAYGVDAPVDLIPLMADPSFRGDVLLVTAEDDGARVVPALRVAVPAAWTASQSLAADDSRDLAYQVQRFDANNLIVQVTNPEPTGAWMSYADVWHPSWHATVNGQPVPVYRAALAYKAIPLAGGENLVHFQFGSTAFSVLSAMFALNAAFWLAATVWMIWVL